MRKWLIGCGVLFGVVLVLCIGVLVWAFTPPKIRDTAAPTAAQQRLR
jgi:hypothetical protein